MGESQTDAGSPSSSQVVAIKDELRRLVSWGLSRRTLRRLTRLHELSAVQETAGIGATEEALAKAAEQVIREVLDEWTKNASDGSQLGGQPEGRAVQILLRATSTTKVWSAERARNEAIAGLGLHISPERFKDDQEHRLLELLAARLLRQRPKFENHSLAVEVERDFSRDESQQLDELRSRLGTVLAALEHDVRNGLHAWSSDETRREHKLGALWNYARLIVRVDNLLRPVFPFVPRVPKPRLTRAEELLVVLWLMNTNTFPFRDRECSRLRLIISNAQNEELDAFLGSLEASGSGSALIKLWLLWMSSCQCSDDHWDEDCRPHEAIWQLTVISHTLFPTSQGFSRMRSGMHETLILDGFTFTVKSVKTQAEYRAELER